MHNKEEIENRINFLIQQSIVVKNEVDKKLLNLENICKEIIKLQEKVKDEHEHQHHHFE